MNFNGKHIVVVGLAKSGAAIARYLKKNGAVVTVTDKQKAGDLGERVDEMKALGIRTELGTHNTRTFLEADMIVLSPGVPHRLPQIQQASEMMIPVVGEVELASMFIREPIVAVTGTNGKTTVTTLISKMLEASGFRVYTGGNIGTPLSEYVMGDERCDVVVAEISSFQLDTIKTFRPDVAVLLNITDDHLDRYEDFYAYARSKGRIFENQEKDDIAVINSNDPASVDISRVLQNRKYFFGNEVSDNCAVIGENSISLSIPGSDPQVIDLSGTKLIGNHNRENIAASALAVLSIGGTFQSIQSVINTFGGLPHRIEYVETVNDTHWYNDSKATNIDAVIRALDSFDSPVTLIMGGRNKGGNFEQLKPSLTGSAKSIIAIGESKEEIRSSLGDTVKVTLATTLENAVEIAGKDAEPGQVVLFSPACSSFDMFNNYEHRGDSFRHAVKQFKERINA